MGLGLLLLGRPALAQTPKTVRIGVIRGSAAIPSLDFTQSGFEVALTGTGLNAGSTVIYDVQRIGSDPQEAQAIIQKFLEAKVDLIHAIGTAPTLAAMKATTTVPVMFSAVTDPVGSGIVPAGVPPGKPTGINVTGVSDRWPLNLQIETYARIIPWAAKWGTLYNPAESNSMSQIIQMRAAFRKLGLELIELKVSNTVEARAAAVALVEKVQALFIMADNTVSGDIQSVVDVAWNKRIPFFGGSLSSVSRGALAAFGIDYFLVGYAAGKKAALVLRGVHPGQIPWSLAEHFGLVLNQKAARALGITIPAEMLRIADKVVE